MFAGGSLLYNVSIQNQTDNIVVAYRSPSHCNNEFNECLSSFERLLNHLKLVKLTFWVIRVTSMNSLNLVFRWHNHIWRLKNWFIINNSWFPPINIYSQFTLQKKWIFPLRISSVNVIKSSVSSVSFNFTKSNTPPWMFFMFFKLCAWY